MDMDRATASGGGGAFTGGGLRPIDASVTASEVCCEPADALLANARRRRGARAPTGTRALRLGVLTCSDRASAGEYEDLSGPSVIAATREYAAVSGSFTVVDVASATAADDVDAIRNRPRRPHLSMRSRLHHRRHGVRTARCHAGGDLARARTPDTGHTGGDSRRDVARRASRRALSRPRGRRAIRRPRAQSPGRPSAAKQWLGIALPLIPRVMETLAERP